MDPSALTSSTALRYTMYRCDDLYNSSDRGRMVHVHTEVHSGRGLAACLPLLLKSAPLAACLGALPAAVCPQWGSRECGGTSCPDFGRMPMERCGLVMWEEPSLSGLSSFCFSPLLPSHSNKRGLGWIMCEGLIRGSCAYLLACYRDVAMSL